MSHIIYYFCVFIYHFRSSIVMFNLIILLYPNCTVHTHKYTFSFKIINTFIVIVWRKKTSNYSTQYQLITDKEAQLILSLSNLEWALHLHIQYHNIAVRRTWHSATRRLALHRSFTTVLGTICMEWLWTNIIVDRSSVHDRYISGKTLNKYLTFNSNYYYNY